MKHDLTTERPTSGERVILVHVFFANKQENFANSAAIEEFAELARSADAEILSEFIAQRSKPTAKYLIGKGKVAELKSQVDAQQAEVVLFNYPLTPAQERNLERELQCRVLDRTSLILDIFAQRARSFEGKLQVELAQLKHLSSRLVRGWTHLERQKGGIGLRGPGETQLETDRRLLNLRIKMINQRLAKVVKQRQQSRQARQRAEIATASLVGYTNAGKSTLFNTMTAENIYVADQLFATLDPTLRRVELSRGNPIILADTVGFIQQLPHELVKAFHATLEETRSANLLIHVIDASNELRNEQKQDVEEVLAEIDADKIPRLEIYNKIDLLEDCEPHIDYDKDGKPSRVWLSAATGVGIELLQQALIDIISKDIICHEIQLKPEQGQLRAKFYELGRVEHESVDELGNIHITVYLPRYEFLRLASQYPKIIK